MKPEFAILSLWLIAVVATILIVDQSGVFTFLGPLFAICTIGSVVTVRRVKMRANR